MNALRLALLGASGRMGQALLSLLEEDPPLKERFLVVEQGSSRNPQLKETLARARPQVAIDFTLPETSLKIAAVTASLKIPTLVCSTGFTPAQLKRLDILYHGRAWALVPNTSLGVFALAESLKVLARSLPAEFSFSILEAHHTAKRDAPSGTALFLAEALKEASALPRQIDIQSVRGGTEPGMHRVLVLGPYEKLEFTHAAQDRKLFARGALVLAEALARKSRRAGRRSIVDLLEI